MQVTLRRGLPRLVGGEAWPPAGTTADLDDPALHPTERDSGELVAVPLRRGLPRVPGGEPFPPEGEALVEAAPALPDTTADGAAQDLVAVPLRRGLPRVPGGEPFPPEGEALVEAAPALPDTTADGAAQDLVAVPLRRGLPRVPGGEPFPPQGEALVESAPAEAAPTEAPPAEAPPAETAPVAESTPVGAEEQAAPEGSAWARGEEPAREAAAEQPVATPARSEGVAQRAAFRRGSRAARWIGGVALALFVLGLGVLAARFLLASDAGGEFIARYDGVQPLPDDAPVGLPAWLNWAHFFNMFLMALIISTGLRVRRERRPAAYWAPTGNPRAKISLTLWMHLMLDLLWLALGAVFYILLFTTGQWMRVVPTSWEAIPNAVSAGLQFLSLEWPTDNAWVHYNALQELTYFAVIFIASPIAAVSGLRMSPWWPAGWTFFSRRTARALHFPTMLFFVGFIIVHVLLVASTGLRRNLNAMFAARGDVDPSVYATDWTGTVFFLFAAALIGLALWGARPAVAAPLARLTGTVSNR